MPAFLEAKLKQKAAEKGFSGKRAARYVYGTLNNIGAMRGSKETSKGKRMQEKHSTEVKHEKMRKLSELS